MPSTWPESRPPADRRQPTTTSISGAELVRMHGTGEYTIAESMEAFSVGRTMVYRVRARTLPGAGQLGCALALVLILPLGDIVRRRTLVGLLLCAAAAALVVMAVAPTVGVLLAAAVVIGLASAGVVNVLVSYTAALAGDGERGRAVANLLIGGLTGILLSRPVAGLAADLVGWRALLASAAVVTALLAALLSRVMAPASPPVAIGYTEQLVAFGSLIRYRLSWRSG